MRAHTFFFTTLVLATTLTAGCAANVDEPVTQVPEPTPAAEPPPELHGGELRIIDPVMQAIIEMNNGTHLGGDPPRQAPFEIGPQDPGR